MMTTEFNERAWLAWLIKVRIMIITFLLGIELVIIRLTPTSVPTRIFILVIALWYTISVFLMALHKLWQETRIQSALHILTDLAFATGVIYVSGGIDTSFNFLYPLVIIVACILLPRWWAYLTAALAFILLGGMLELSYYDVIRSYSTTRPDPKSLQAIIIINLFAYMAIAYLASTLSYKLRITDVELQDKSGALENLQALHENIIHSMRGGLITTDLYGRITLLNAPGQKLLGVGFRNVYSQPVTTLFAGRLPNTEGSSAQGEVRYHPPFGPEKTFGVTVSALTVPDRGKMGYVYTFDDLTEIRRLEREVRMRDRLSAVGRMAAGIAHEIRNPLSSIAGSVQVLAHISALSDEQRVLVDIVKRESERLNNIISEFLIYSREKNYDFGERDLVPILNETLALLENRESQVKLEIVREYNTATAMALIDGDKMRQVFWNLCENAVRAMPEGGRLTVGVSEQNDSWRILFKDTGPGLSAQQAEKVFEPFQTYFAGGTGLGLAIVYQILQAHQSKIWVLSTPGQGAEFVLEIKQAKPVMADRALASAGGASHG